jgi:hypothetical protein
MPILKAIFDFFKRPTLILRVEAIFYFAPMLIICCRFYKQYYGLPNIELSKESITAFVFTKQFGLTALLFFGIFAVAYYLENDILPILLSLTSYKVDFPHWDSFTRKMFGKLAHDANRIVEESTSNIVEKSNFLRSLMFLPVVVVLWCIAINTWWAYACMVFPIGWLILSAAVINSWADTVRSKDVPTVEFKAVQPKDELVGKCTK